MIKKTVFLPLFLLSVLGSYPAQGGLPLSHLEYPAPTQDKAPEASSERKRIQAITITGNKLVTKEALYARIPYRIGELFNPTKTGDLIKNLYGLNYFNNVIVESEDFSDTEIILHITVEEKKKIESIVYEGNTNLSNDEIDKKLKISEIPTFDEEELSFLAGEIKALYAEKNYHNVGITTELRPTENSSYIAFFRIEEGEKAIVKRIYFEGNTKVSSKFLRSILYTREDWLFGFVTKAGSFQQEMLEADKYAIENFYQSSGFLAARVLDVTVDRNEATQCIVLTFHIEEGDLYTIKSVGAQGNELLTEEQILPFLPLCPGQLYSRELVRQSVEMLRTVWGRYGYIYADIEPVIIPNFEDKTVDITFNSELGNKLFLRRINICGNNKTRDYVIRREMALCEGQVLTTIGMDASISRVEALGFFDPMGGVEWRVNKVSPDTVDLDLIVREKPTGRLEWRMGYGGADPQSSSTSFSVGIGLSDRNLLGSGVSANLNAQWSRQDHSFDCVLYKPWLFNRPVGGTVRFYHRRMIYEDVTNINSPPVETTTGANTQISFAIPACPTIISSIALGVQRIHFQDNLRAERGSRNNDQNELFQTFINRRFISGTNATIDAVLGQDMRNHPVLPNKGYNWNFTTTLGIPAPGSPIGYLKADFDTTWLTPLIGEYDLIFLMHSHAGYVLPLGDKLIPYRELYNIGGPGTVRGFDFGQIGPQVFCSSVGARKAFWVNAELIFSIMKDNSIRGILFYDGGAGWDTPLSADQKKRLAEPANKFALTNNRFRYRHSVGFGIRLQNPAPIRIDWGFKLDRNKRLREKAYEVHFSMQQEF
ncbi:outer membrane protein assembly factor BamA [Candidatus Dependentiae bacterium]|nr:outer membrane protein assembly factor BamA [Candidatus Dependentiae bacterium]